jgi:hypothetical protein
MRSIWSLLISGTLATLVAGCNLVNDFRFYRDGIGTELYVSETVAATANLDAYIADLCLQAGLPRGKSADGAAYCTISNSSADWALVVLAGMNDIDGRCDAYLAWLDDKRRSNEPFLKQLAATGAATLGILDATSAGVKAITITGIAFGLAANTFTNFNARILSLEQSTVQSVVLDNQQLYRENNKPTAIQSRPAAIYYLRNYLRICMPFSIETSINNTVTVFHRSGPDALTRNAIFTRSVIDNADAPMQEPARFGLMNPGGRTKFEREGLTPARAREMMAVVCPRPRSTNLDDLRTAVLDFLNRSSAAGITASDAQRITDKFNANGRKPIPCS